MLVHVYRNLNKGGYSIRCPKTRRVIGYADAVTLLNVTLKVGAASQARARREGARNVHAWAEGTLAQFPVCIGERVSYNPFTDAGFVIRASGKQVTTADCLVLNETGCFLGKPLSSDN